MSISNLEKISGRFRFNLIACMTVALLSVSPTAQAANMPLAGFTALFNGRDLSGWWGTGMENPASYETLSAAEFQKKHDDSLNDVRQHWSVKKGQLVNDGQGLFLTTDKNYGDFELLMDYQTASLADGGIFLRGYPKVQISNSAAKNDLSVGGDKHSGGLWNHDSSSSGNDPLVNADMGSGKWNHFRIIMCGSRVWVWLNGKMTVNGAVLENYFDHQLSVLPTGPIQLQAHGGKICWRNIFIREIGSDEAVKLLRGADPVGYDSVFNGQDLTGWSGSLDCCRVTNSAILWQLHKGGTIYTQAEYTNFAVRLEFKLPPGCNNGLAIRYPGEGDTAYVGMCECQVLDDNYEKNTGSKIDPRQAHGSAYGMVPAQRGYQHPIGEWNYEEVIVVGSTIRVELNGTPILNADLSKVTEFMDNKEHPGKDRKSGHFGFAGHSDPVMFRNISIKPLD